MRASGEEDPCGIRLRREEEQAFGVAMDYGEIHIYADGLWSFSDSHRLADFIPANLRERQFTCTGLRPPAGRRTAGPFSWKYTAHDLKGLLRRISEHAKKDVKDKTALTMAA